MGTLLDYISAPETHNLAFCFKTIVATYRSQASDETELDEQIDWIRETPLRFASRSEIDTNNLPDGIEKETVYGIINHGKKQFGVFDLEELMRRRKNFVKAMATTSCKDLLFILPMFFTHAKTKVIDSDAFAMFYTLYRSYYAIDRKDSMMIWLSPENTLILPTDQYCMPTTQVRAADVIADCSKTDLHTVYYIDISSANQKEGGPGQLAIDNTFNDEKFQEAWNLLTSHPPHSHHSFLLIINNFEFALVQSYFGHYSMKEWLDFNKDLKMMEDLPNPHKLGWTRKLIPRPTFRGVLETKKLGDLCSLLKSLEIHGDHISAYSELTGIVHDKQSIAKRYVTTTLRLNLDCIPFVRTEM